MVSFKEYLADSMSMEEFLDRTRSDPAWCLSIKKPLRIIGDMSSVGNAVQRRLQYLSPHLTFDGYVDFAYSENLKVATGTFNEFADFSSSAVERIENFVSNFNEGDDRTVDFSKCENLKVATGTCYGMIDFFASGIEEIRDLNILGPSETGRTAASFAYCKKLKEATGTYPGWVNFSNSGVEEIRDLHITAPTKGRWSVGFDQCNIKKISNFTYKGKINADAETLKLIAEYEAKVAAEKITGKAEEGPLNGFF